MAGCAHSSEFCAVHSHIVNVSVWGEEEITQLCAIISQIISQGFWIREEDFQMETSLLGAISVEEMLGQATPSRAFLQVIAFC